MRRNTIKIILLSVCIILGMVIAGPVYADDGEESNPGITSDSPFYIFDSLMKKMGMFFAFSDEAKVKKALEYATERLVEADVMAAQNKLGEFKLGCPHF